MGCECLVAIYIGGTYRFLSRDYGKGSAKNMTLQLALFTMLLNPLKP